MIAGTFALSAAEVDELRARHPFAPDQTWIPGTVKTEGWEATNIRYLDGERRRSREAMRDLLCTLGVIGVTTAEEAVDLVSLALQVFTPEEGFTGFMIRQSGSELRISSPQCSTFSLIEAQNWHGVTACASWHRCRGWLDALGVVASYSVLADKKWGDPMCVCLLCVEGVLARS